MGGSKFVSVPAPETLSFNDRVKWEEWLVENHAASSGVWLLMAKKGALPRCISHPEALEVSLCFGWIDAQRKSGPEGFWLQRFTPRSSRSIWSRINRTKALQLIEEGRMQACGLAAIEEAKRNGQWDSAYDGPRAIGIPEDLATELAKNARARTFFDQLSSQNRYAILFRLQKVKRPDTRTKHLQRYLDMLEKGETLHPQSKGEKIQGR